METSAGLNYQPVSGNEFPEYYASPLLHCQCRICDSGSAEKPDCLEKSGFLTHHFRADRALRDFLFYPCPLVQQY
jgi:hypothetical protein